MNDKFVNLLTSGVRNISQSFHDSFVEANAKFRSKAGLKVTIVRESMGECCSWCSDLAGTYTYDNAPKDVYARHRDCNCVVSTKTSKGTWQDAWSKKEFKTFRENRIEREKEILEDISEFKTKNIVAKTKIEMSAPKNRNVTPEYCRAITPGRGKIKREKGFEEKNHEKEIETANWIHKTFGGNITLNKDSKTAGKHYADFTWNGKLWDLKTIGSNKYNTIDQHIRDGHKQIMTKRGGIIIDMTSNQLSKKEMVDIITESCNKRKMPQTDFLIKKGDSYSFFRIY